MSKTNPSPVIANASTEAAAVDALIAEYMGGPSAASVADDFKGVAPLIRKLAVLPDLIDRLAARESQLYVVRARVHAAEVAAQQAEEYASLLRAEVDAEIAGKRAAADAALDEKRAQLAAVEDERAAKAAECMVLEKRKAQLDAAYSEMRQRAGLD